MPRAQANLTPTAYTILGLLYTRPMHGYEIARYFRPDTELGQVVPADMSTVYTFLKELQEQGLICGERITVGSRPPRTVFSVTREAEALFLDWLHRPVARMREVRLDFLLKLYFLRHRDVAEVQALVEAQITACRRYLDRLKAAQRELDPTGFEYLVLESKLNAAQSVLTWLRSVADRPKFLAGKRSDAEIQAHHSRFMTGQNGG